MVLVGLHKDVPRFLNQLCRFSAAGKRWAYDSNRYDFESSSTALHLVKNKTAVCEQGWMPTKIGRNNNYNNNHISDQKIIMQRL